MTDKVRPRISIYIAASIDGYIARKDNSLDWMDRVGGYDEDYGFKKLLDSTISSQEPRNLPYKALIESKSIQWSPQSQIAKNWQNMAFGI